MVADPESVRKAISNIQRKLLERKRKQIAKVNQEKKEAAKIKLLDKKVAVRTSKEKIFQKGSKRISIDDRDRLVQTVNKIKSRNSNLTQKTDVLPT